MAMQQRRHFLFSTSKVGETRNHVGIRIHEMIRTSGFLGDTRNVYEQTCPNDKGTQE